VKWERCRLRLKICKSQGKQMLILAYLAKKVTWVVVQYKSRFSGCFVTSLISCLEVGVSGLASFKLFSLKLVFVVGWILAGWFKQFFMRLLP
jgi:hypothetical protein